MKGLSQGVSDEMGIEFDSLTPVLLNELNDELEMMLPEARVAWTLANLPGKVVMSSSFGAQAAVSLHMISRQMPDVPVILLDTGYLFPETYRFIDEMVGRLDLNLQVFRSEISPAWIEARYGKLWCDGKEGIGRYNRLVKVEPMKRALRELDAGVWLTGLRREQADTRKGLKCLSRVGKVWKVHPLVDWTDHDIHGYLQSHQLSYHPLWHRGYVSIGDIHTTKPLHEVDDPEHVRFFGLKRECGIHEIELEKVS